MGSPAHHQPLVAGGAADGRQGNLPAPAEILASGASRLGDHLAERTGGDDFPPANACAGAEIDHPIGRANRFLVVFHHDNRIALVTQRGQCVEQSLVVAGMKPDRRLIQHV